jgi:hypothetical protein
VRRWGRADLVVVLRVAVAVAVVLLAAGCGQNADEPGSRERGTPTAGAAASQSFARTADAICTEMQADAAKLVGTQRPSDADIGRIVKTWRASLDDLAALEPPPASAAEFRKMIAAYRRTLDAIEALVAAQDESVLVAVAGVSLFGHRGTRSARRASLEQCMLFQEVTQPEADPEPLGEAALALVPPRVDIVRAAKHDCAADSSCVIEFRGSGALAARVRAARRKLAARGWTNIRSGRTPGTGSAWLMANRNDYSATVELVAAPLPSHCSTGRVTWGCVDSVWVHRVEVPEAFLADD